MLVQTGAGKRTANSLFQLIHTNILVCSQTTILCFSDYSCMFIPQNSVPKSERKREQQQTKELLSTVFVIKKKRKKKIIGRFMPHWRPEIRFILEVCYPMMCFDIFKRIFFIMPFLSILGCGLLLFFLVWRVISGVCLDALIISISTFRCTWTERTIWIILLSNVQAVI